MHRLRSLLTIYELLIRHLSALVCNECADDRVWMAGLLEGAMVIVLMTLLCCAGVAFYVRFLVALCKEYRLGGIWYLVRLQPGGNQIKMVSMPRAEPSLPRAA